ncbi:cation-translocating P-type ATPase [Hydrogenimonas thermophila]|uniref:Plasma-membrane calcium-translocating P-type ATPase n=1 Tax=Hydrogenimonas thermophila TaxID=223786 RepID=A0A1I5UNV5_9BACT|nr:HAD-IC family P-type ATPase [Hydrogenimonas thermophila]SFP96953.1 plasma-membrane calcium-translocating P-type ATPase [Hydrogenimonas thermophila]
MEAFHTLSIEETLKVTESSPSGLTEAEAQKRLGHYGPNSLPESKTKPLLLTFFEQFKSPIIIILLIASTISFIIGEVVDAWFILAVLGINAVIGTYLEHSAAQKAQALKSSVKTYANVLRDSQISRIEAKDLTIGDIVLLESGDKVPADIRLIESRDLMVDESLLTGESVAVKKSAEKVFEDIELPVADQSNMLFAGTYVTSGRGKGVVVAVGLQTQIGKIAEMLAQKSKAKIPLIERLERFSKNIAIAVTVASVFLFFIALYRHMEIAEIFFLILALFVSAVPEGLPVAITVALAAAAVAMSKRNVIVRKLAAIEGLGSCTIIATDKTGTLTENQLHIQEFITPDKVIKDPQEMSETIAKTLVVANEAHMSKKESISSLEGDQVDVAFAMFALKKEPSFETLLESKRVDVMPYESAKKMSGATIKDNEGYLHVIKGSPEVILDYIDINEDEQRQLMDLIDQKAANGYRIIAVAKANSNIADIETLLKQKQFEWIGFSAIVDPLRDGAKEAVKRCQQAGIAVAMITGDHPSTAYHIAKELEIAMSPEEVMDAEKLNRWAENGSDPKEIADKRVFARVAPAQKLQIVQAFQQLGEYVAVTGDGVNDAPALKFANIGISMGRSGTDVAKESADLILTDDAFPSIVNGIEEGRRAYDNIRKVVHLLISTGFAEIILVLLSLIFSTPVPLLPIHLLWLNLVTNGIQDVALGLEKAEPGILNRPPRSPNEAIFNTVMIKRIAIGGLYMGVVAFGLFYYLLNAGYETDSARNLTLMLMVLFENVHVFNSRSEHLPMFKINHLQNPLLILSVIVAQGVHTAALHIPFTQKLLSVEPVPMRVWDELLLLAFGLVLVMELEKYIRKKIEVW